MKIGLISDTHGDYGSFNTAFENILRDVDIIIHAGDILNHGPRNVIPSGYAPEKLAYVINKLPVDILFVKGNCDSDVDQMLINYLIGSPYLYLIIEGFKTIVNHGNKKIDKKYFKNIDFYISGHTHIYNVEHIDSTIFINPGSLSIPKNHINGTCGIIDTIANIVHIYDIFTKNILIENNFS